MRKTLFVFTVLFSVMVCGAANATEKSPIYLLLSGVLHPHGPLPPQSPYFVPSLNDTGITWGGSYPSGNNVGCTGVEIGAQDCSHGRDKIHNDDSDGHTGFSFTKLDANGVPLVNQAVTYATKPWACVKDNVTGLIWEVKTNDGGLHDQDDSYTWYNTNPATNGGANGYDNQGNTCKGYVNGNPSTYCNTQAYVARVNAVGWCGRSDWRMPTVNELESIVSFGTRLPAIDTGYFPNTNNSFFWSASPSSRESLNNAWSISFDDGSSFESMWSLGSGESDSLGRGHAFHVRLVRNGQ